MYQEKVYYVYILTNKSNDVFYIGITNNLERRLLQHKGIHGEYDKQLSSFTARYNLHKLIYYEIYHNVEEAIQREKEIKGWRKQKKTDLIETKNKYYRDLSTNFINFF